MRQYSDILSMILADGELVETRAGLVKRLSHEFFMTDLRNGFPAITGRKLFWQPMAAELACFVKGYTDILEFRKRGCKIWDKDLARHNIANNTPLNTDLGRIYGSLWRDFQGVDQLRAVINEAKVNPASRRLLVTAWDPSITKDQVLPPCHYAFQLSVVNGHLDLIFSMRSVDMAVGFPFDIASYGLLTHLIANELGLTPRYLTASLADAHIYLANAEGVEEYLSRQLFAAPTLQLNILAGTPVEDFEPANAKLINYVHGSPIQFEMQAGI